MADRTHRRGTRPVADDPAADQPTQGVGDLATARDFLALLDAMRKSRKLSYRQISRRAGKGMSSSTAQAMVAGDALPALPKLHLFLAGCNVPPEERRRWINTWHRINQSSPEAGTADTPPPAAPQPVDTTSPPSGPLPQVAAIPSHPPDAPVPPVPEPPSQRRLRRQAAGQRLRFPLLALAAFTVAVGVLTASAIFMWVYGVPLEIMYAVYGLLAVSVTSWMLVAQRQLPGRPPTRGGLVQGDPLVFVDPMPVAAKPIIGE